MHMYMLLFKIFAQQLLIKYVLHAKIQLRVSIWALVSRMFILLKVTRCVRSNVQYICHKIIIGSK